MTKRRKTDDDQTAAPPKKKYNTKKSIAAAEAAAAAAAAEQARAQAQREETAASTPGSYKHTGGAGDEGDGDAYEDDDDDDGEEFGGVTSQDAHASSEAQDREKLRLLLANFSESQMSRYEAFRRANLNRTGIKKLANAVLNQSITANVAVTLSGLAKVFVGELVEKAREVEQRMDREFLKQQKEAATKKRKQEGDGDAGIEDVEEEQQPPPLLALRPEHMREAWRLYRKEMGTVPNAQWRRQGGEGDGRMFR